MEVVKKCNNVIKENSQIPVFKTRAADGFLNLLINNKNQLVLPCKNPINDSDLEYVNQNGIPLIPMIRQLQKTIDYLPVSLENLWKQACSGDQVTNTSWKPKWNKALDNNEKKYDFSGKSCMEFYRSEAYKPIILAGSGPSLKYNAKYLKETYLNQTNLATGKTEEVLSGGRKDIKIVSCLHNFSYFEDNEYMTSDDFYCNLDAGPITISELSEGGRNSESWYWDRTKERKLITTVLACPELLDRWQGEIYFYKTGSSVIDNYSKRVDPSKIPTFSVGGNVLGASLYFAKAILGAGPIIFIGADFCFSYDHKFHGWDSQYDSQFRGVIPVTDIFGNRVFTWPSYFNFKCFFDFISAGGMGKNPQLFINATEGGLLGAYPEGNIRQIHQISLKEALHIFTMHTKLPNLLKNSNKQEIVLF